MTQTVPVDVVAEALETARRCGLDVERVMRESGFDSSLLTSTRSGVTIEQAVVLVRRMWQITDDELFGLGTQPLPRGTFRLISFALVSAPDLRTVLDRIAEFSQLLPGFPAATVTVDGDECRFVVEVDQSTGATTFLTELLLASMHRFLGWLIGRHIPLVSVEVPYASPASGPAPVLLFGTQITHAAPGAALVFGADLLSSPVMRDEDALMTYIRNSPRDLLGRRDYGTTVADQVRRILERGVHGDWPAPEAIAARLTTSPQNLRRVLREEGTSITEIKQEILRDTAIASLVIGLEPVADLSLRLGFSEPSAFHRAFRRWTGGPLSTYRPQRPARH
jgi:AraC-like DNA-binding protein